MSGDTKPRSVSTTWCALAVGLASTLAALTPAKAQDSAIDPQSLTGVWRFQTEVEYNLACVMSGEMVITADENQPGVYTCEFEAFEDCERGQVFRAQQVCTASLDSGTLEIASEVIQVEPTPPEGSTYLPDNFSLNVRSSRLMEGVLWFATTRTPARFERPGLSIS